MSLQASSTRTFGSMRSFKPASRPSIAPRASRAHQVLVRADLVSSAKQQLKTACQTKSTPPDQVLEYLKEVETAHKASSLVQNFPQVLNGTWRLVFATPAPIPSWAYIPVIEDAIINVEDGTIALKSFLGPFEFTFSGKAAFKSQPEQQVYDMNFSFNASEIAVFGFKWQGTREPKEKTYSFFLAEDELAAVNSSATGGKTLMYRGKL